MLFRVILKKPESAGDFWYGYWLKPVKKVNNVFVFRQEYFKAFDLLTDEPSGICPVTGNLDSCLACFNGGHMPDEYIKFSAFEVKELLEKHPYTVKAISKPSASQNYIEMIGFYTEIDTTDYKKNISFFAVNVCEENALKFWESVNYSID